jgi:hypothetical protein
LMVPRWLVKTKVVPELSRRTTVWMSFEGSPRSGLAATIRGSSYFQILPLKMST